MKSHDIFIESVVGQSSGIENMKLVFRPLVSHEASENEPEIFLSGSHSHC